MNKKHLVAFLMCSLGFSGALLAQKAPIDHSTYDLWNSISNAHISKTGNYIFYSINPQEGDGYFELKDNKNKLLYRVERGAAPKLTENESFLITTLKAPFKEVREAKIKKKKSEDFPKDSLLVYNIAKQQQQQLGAFKNLQLAQNSRDYIAFTQEISIKAEADTAKGKPAKDKKENVVVLHQLQTSDTLQFRKVDNYFFSQDEKYFVFHKKTDDNDSTGVDGLYLYDLDQKALTKISNGKGVYKNITFDDQNKQLAFLADKSPAKSLSKDFKLYLYRVGQDTARIIVDKSSQAMPTAWSVSGDGRLSFNAQADRLFFGIAPIPAVKDSTLVDFENAKVDIWHWKDDYLMPQQLVNLKRDLSKNYDAVYHINRNQFIPLIDDKFDRTSYTETADQEWLLATSTYGNRIAAQWQAYQLQDIYLISTLTGERKLVKSNWNGQAYLAPDAKQVVLFDQPAGQWYSYHVADGTTQHLNKGLTVSFADEENDMPADAGAYGIAAWADNQEGVYINDRYDLWYFSFDGKTQRCVTQQYGRNNKIVLRGIFFRDSNPRNRTTKLKEKSPLLLSSFHEVTKENGLFRLTSLKGQKPTEIIQDKYSFKNPMANEKQNLFIYTKENYEASPDLYLSADFKKEQRLTNSNPQQSEYNWGTAELVHWTTPNGHQAEGILYKPENFDPNKKYPIIAYFYETLTQGLYSYQPPAPTPSRLNIPYFVSNEYLVFAPDIRYEDGHPGKSAEEYINSGMLHLAKNSWVDASKMAIQGQSWGGYQVAHLITRTHMYAAAWTGAPVVNMTSAYGGIRWASGMSRQFQYEKTQSRLGATLWENLDLYIENSPIFFMDKVNTPVAIMHNDNDGAVPWYQGIEMFTALRRLEKPVWLLNYNGDEHNLMQRQNRKDIQIRQSQFFDHFLKGKPAAKWISEGRPAINKGIDWAFD